MTEPRRARSDERLAALGGPPRVGIPGLTGLVAVAAVLPAWLTWREQGLVAPFRFFAADAFYYLAVADRSQGRPFYTFDGLFPTNGFHPLWQWLLDGLFTVLGGDRELEVLLPFVIGAVLVALGAALLATVVARATGQPALALLAAVPGFYFLLLPPIAPSYFAVWSFANGMESGPSILAFAWLAHRLIDPRLQGEAPPLRCFVALGVAGTAVTLARLDDVFLLGSLLLLAWATSRSPREALSRVLAVGLPPLLGIGAYLAYNLASVGVLLPVSGAAKAEGPWALARNGYATLTTLAPFVDLFGRGNATWGPEAWRVLQMLVPAAAAGLHLLARGGWRIAGWRNHLREPLVLLALYVLAKAAYNFTLVPLWHQGQWYYPVSLLVFGWIVADGAARLLARAGPDAVAWGRSRVAFALCALLVLVQANAFADQKRSGGLGLTNYDLWRRGPEIDAALEARCPGCGVVEFDDGILSFVLDRPVMNGLGLMLDPEAAAARRAGRLLALAHARGFTLLATAHYAMPAAAYADPQALRLALARNVQLRGQRLEDFDFAVLYTDEASGVHFVAFTPSARSATSSRPHPVAAGQPLATSSRSSSRTSSFSTRSDRTESPGVPVAMFRAICRYILL